MAAFLDLVDEGRARPRIDEVASRAGVARRTVHLHHRTFESLLTAAVEDRVDTCGSLVPQLVVDLVLTDRLALSVDRLDACYVRIAPVERSVVTAGLDTPSSDAARHLTRLDHVVVEHVRRTYRRELLATPDPLDALVRLESALSFSLWRYLRALRRLDRSNTRRYMTQMARAALGMLGSAAA